MPLEVNIEQFHGHSILRWHINEPASFNAIGPTLANSLAHSMEQAKQQKKPVRALLITAEISKSSAAPIWIAGGNLKELSQHLTIEQGLAYAQTMHKVCREMELLPFPVITYVNGRAIGGGAELAIAADIRIATSSATFEWKQLKMGLTTGYGSAYRLIDLLGKAKAQKLMYLSETLSADQALEWGLVHQIVKHEGDLEHCLQSILSLDPLALLKQKQMFHSATKLSSTVVEMQDDLFSQVWANDTHLKALKSFLEK